MSNDLENLKSLWKEQKVEVIEMKVLTHLDDDFRGSISRRNWLEWIACALVAVFFGRMTFADNHILVRAGGAVCVVAAIYIAYVLWRRGRTENTVDPTNSLADNLAQHRQNLEKQAELLQAAPRWYVLPIVVGWAMIWVGNFLEKLNEGAPLHGHLAYLAGCVIFFAFVAWLNRRGAAKLRRRAAELGLSDARR